MQAALLGALVGMVVRWKCRVEWSLWRFADDYGTWATILTIAFVSPFSLIAFLTTGRVDLRLTGEEAGVFWLACLCTARLLAARMWVNWTSSPRPVAA